MNLARKFACTSFARFINSAIGRIVRVIAGTLLIAWGFTHLGQDSAYIFIIVGIVPFAAGALDLCLISPLLGGPITGKKVRSISSMN